MKLGVDLVSKTLSVFYLLTFFSPSTKVYKWVPAHLMPLGQKQPLLIYRN